MENQMNDEDKQNLSYIQKLRTSANTTESIVCMDLNPILELMPTYGEARGKIRIFYDAIFEKMEEKNVFPGAFKIRQELYEAFDEPFNRNYRGMDSIADTMEKIRKMSPEIPIILDSQRNCTDTHNPFEYDAITIHPLAGNMPKDFHVNNNLGIYISNVVCEPGKEDFQFLNVMSGTDVYPKLKTILMRHNGNVMSPEYLDHLISSTIEPMIRSETKPLYKAVAEKIVEWGKNNQGIGAVVNVNGENHSSLSDIATILSPYHRPLNIKNVNSESFASQWILVSLNCAHYDIGLVRIDTDNKLLYPWGTDKAPDNWADIVVDNLKKLNEKINYVSRLS